MANEQITASEAEEFVRAYWAQVIEQDSCTVLINIAECDWQRFTGKRHKWLAAYQYTLAHQQKIADVEAETRYVNSMPRRFQTPAPEVQERLLARLESIRAELRRGVRQ